MSKLEVIDGKQTTWDGLWWHSECQYYSSAVISLAQLRKFKGNVRLYVKKNRYYNNGKNGRPNYHFSLRDANSDNVRELELQDVDDDMHCENLHTETGDYFECSECGETWKVENAHWMKSFEYCPSCGRKIQ